MAISPLNLMLLSRLQSKSPFLSLCLHVLRDQCHRFSTWCRPLLSVWWNWVKRISKRYENFCSQKIVQKLPRAINNGNCSCEFILANQSVLQVYIGPESRWHIKYQKWTYLLQFLQHILLRYTVSMCNNHCLCLYISFNISDTFELTKG